MKVTVSVKQPPGMTVEQAVHAEVMIKVRENKLPVAVISKLLNKAITDASNVAYSGGSFAHGSATGQGYFVSASFGSSHAWEVNLHKIIL